MTLVRRRADGPVETVLPAPWNVRSRVHEYGGRAYAARPDGSVVFADYADQRLYRMDPGGDPWPLTPAAARPAGLRYVEPFFSADGDEVWCIREEHHSDSPTDVSRALVAVPLDGSAADAPGLVRVVVADRHFLACPQVSPDGTQVAWIGWDHPHMPWDSSEVRVAPLHEDGTAGRPRTVLGGPEESVTQVGWLADGSLLVSADRTGWWNLHRVDPATGTVEDLCVPDEEFGGPAWMLGYRWFTPLADGRVLALHGRGSMRPGVLDPATGTLADLETTYPEWVGMLDAADGRVVGVAGAADRAYRVVALDTATGDCTTISEPDDTAALAGHLPKPQARTFPAAGGREVHAHVYPPRNPLFAAPEGEPVPYVVFVHGGPTSRSPMVLDLEIAYLTSRGLGVVDVNYGGSTGYGREYRDRLRESWGVVDVEDSVAVAEALVAEGLADPDRLAIRGGSAGGWTTAATLTSSEVFACGAISYPILDLTTWQKDGTHDFESRYLHSLVGPWPETAQRYAERSPITRAERLTKPFVLLQGLEDVICPPTQAERFLDRVAGRGIPHAYLTFEGEQHGFRREETIVAALEAELSLYGQVFGFDPPGVTRLELDA
ncbi:MAG: prolyl oligopeptidase family serine peptidase [Nocardioides sp.]